MTTAVDTEGIEIQESDSREAGLYEKLRELNDAAHAFYRAELASPRGEGARRYLERNEPGFLERYAEAYQAEMAHFFAYVAGREESLRVTAHDGLRALELAEAANQSLKSGQAVELYALVDLDDSLRLSRSWLALGRDHLAIVTAADTWRSANPLTIEWIC